MKHYNHFKDIDLLILDADGTIAPNMIVSTGNHIVLDFARNMFGLKQEKHRALISTKTGISELITIFFKIRKIKFRSIPKLIKFCYLGSKLYIKKYYKDTLYYFNLNKVDNTSLIKDVMKIVKGIDISRHYYDKKVIESSLYPGVKELIKSFKCKKVMISQSFSYKDNFLDLYKKILGLDEIVSNQLLCEKHTITGLKINVKSAQDKKHFAKKLKKKYKAKKIAVMANDYTDIEMAKLADLVISRKPPARLKKISDIVVNKDYKRI